jgi:adenylate cyclase
VPSRFKRSHRSLKFKFSLFITLLIVLTISLVGAFLLRQEEQSLTAEITKRGLTIAGSLAANAKQPILTSDELTLSLLVRDAHQQTEVAYVIFTDPEGKIVAHSDLNLVGKQLTRPKGLAALVSQPLVQNYDDSKGGRIIDFAMPLVYSKVRLGALYLGFSDRTIRETIARARNQTILITLMMILAGVGGAIVLALFLTRPIRQLVQGTKNIAAGNFLVALPVTSKDELGELTESFNQMAKSLHEKEMIKSAFRRYVAREVAEEVFKNPQEIALSGDRRDVTVLFCDMRGFTPLAERLPPEEVVAMLNDFYGLMIDATFANEGSLEKFLGDAVMAVFGAPVRQSDHCIRAVTTALTMQAQIAALSHERIAQGKEPIAIGIGVSAGEAVAGRVGTENRMEYTVIGDRVNLAARLEANAKPGQILISQLTYDKVADQIEARSLGAIKVKGREEDVEIYEVLGLKPLAV